MSIYVYPADAYGCGYYRMIWPAQCLQAAGHDVKIVMPGEDSGIGGTTRGGRLQTAWCPPDAELIVVQRPAGVMLADTVGILRRNGVAVIVDIDDDLERIHPSNPAWSGLHPRNPTNNWGHVKRACNDATLVTVSTPALADRYGSRDHARVLYNYVPAQFLDVDHAKNERPVLAWAGAIHSHPNDPPESSYAVQRLVREGHLLRVIGDPTNCGRAFGLPFDPAGTGVVPFENWSSELARIDVGMAPLADTQFNAAKSWLKPLEYAALGVPCVVSDRVEYRRLAALGAGEIASSRQNWYRTLRSLLEDENRRLEASERVREVAATLTIEEHAWRWAEVWQEAVVSDRAATAIGV